MMTFEELLQKNEDAIVQRWCEDALATYAADAAAAFRRQKDPFANPIGHRLRAGTRGIFRLLLEGMDTEKLRTHLQEIIKVRAVQQFSASQALDFVFRLKGTIRAELDRPGEDTRFASEWAKLDGQIDQIALAAFDIYVDCREQVHKLRMNEVKRSVSWIVEKLNARGADLGSARIGPE